MEIGLNWSQLRLAGGIIAVLFAPIVWAQPFTLDESPGRVDIRYGEAPVATYVYQDDEISRPFFCNVFAPNGEQVTRRHPTDPIANKDNDDHDTYHPGIWLAFGDLGGADFWRNRARVRHVRFVEAPAIDDDGATFVVENAYESWDDPPSVVCFERCSYSIFATPDGYYLLMDSVFRAETGFTFGDQEEMGLGARIATRFTVQHGSGTIRNSEGGVDENGTWGRTADWCGYYGMSGDTRVGLTIMPSPDNFRRSWFHTRDYGLVVANPFGEKAMTGPNDDSVSPSTISVEAGDAFRLGFGVHVFSTRDIDEEAAYTVYTRRLQSAKNHSE